MKKLVFILLVVLMLPFGVAVSNDKLKSIVPLSVDFVIVARASDHLVRAILYSTEISPQLDIELIKVPEMNVLIDKKTIMSIKVSVNESLKALDFSNSSAVSINNIIIENGFVKFDVEFLVHVGGGYYLSACEVDANNNMLGDAVCLLKKQGL